MLEVNSGSTPEVIAPILSPETYLTSKKYQNIDALATITCKS
jgi:hypothetical protein